MSTKHLREILEYAGEMNHPSAIGAAKEVEAIEKAARGVVDWYRGDSSDGSAASTGLDLLESIAEETP